MGCLRLQWIAALLVASARLTSAGNALDKPSFTASPSELLAEAKAASGTADSEVVVLRDETAVQIDETSRVERRDRVVFLVRKQAGADDWGTLQLEWRPFYQDKPVVRARVIAADGGVSELDQKLITDAPAVNESPVVFSDRRSLEVPLPRLAVGSVVEEEFVMHDREPLLRAGVIDGVGVGRTVPVLHTLITISSPLSRKAYVVARGFARAPTPRVVDARGRSTSTFDLGAMAPFEPIESGIPGDIAPRPAIEISTGASWGAIADDYRKLVDQRLADPKFVAPDGIKGASERETIARAVTWLHAHVRYTGIELSDSAIIPWAPSETIQRGFGDCKDKATLLVAMLRSAGIHADLALVDTGPGIDVARDMPGMGDFDHAIVRAQLAGKDLWIDATEDMLPAGQLPWRDQGRHALIIAPGTRDLVTTPMSSSGDNVVREVRTFHLPEHDRTAITEVSTESGAFTSQREWLRTTSHDELQKDLSRYVEQVYDGKFRTFSVDDPDDLTRHHSLSIEIDDSPRAFTSRNQIDVHLYPTSTLGRLPSALKEKDEQPGHERHFEFAFFSPHVFEVENRLVLPPGYTMPELPPREEQHLGTMTLTTTRHVDKDTLVITYRLDTGKVRLSPAELEATRKALHELREKDADRITIQRTAVVLAQKGKTKEAIAECERIIALHPKEAVHHDELANLYRENGMGAAARREAQKAVELEPKSSDAYDMLAFQLRRDSLGREYGYDADRKGAIAAYRKALELDPKHLGALGDFASLLDHDARGQLTDDMRDRKEAISLWQRAKAVSKDGSYDVQIVTNQLLVGDLASAEASARAMSGSRKRASMLVAAVAAERGAKEATALASSLASDDSRKKILTEAVGVLVLMRRYDLVQALFNEVKDGDTNALQEAMMSRLAIVDRARLDPADPKTPTLLGLAAMFGETIDHPPWAPALGKDLASASSEIHRIPGMDGWHTLPGAVSFDMLNALPKIAIDGSVADGWRVTADFFTAKLSSYVVLESGRARLVAFSDSLDGSGRRILDLLAKGDVARATRWMRWVLEDLARPQHNTKYDAVTAAFKDQPAGAALPRDLLEIGAALLVARSDAKLAVPILKRCAAHGEEVKKQCRAGLETAFGTLQQWSDLAEVEQQALQQDASTTEPVVRRALALAFLGKAADATKLVDDALSRRPDEILLIRMRAQLAVLSKQPDEIRSWYDKVLQHPSARASDFNDAAWAHMFVDASTATAKDLASRAERMETKLSHALANTIATIEAESDEPALAWRYTLRSIDATPQQLPVDEDWYVIGRIAECYGLRDDAIAAYRRLTKPKLRLGDESPYELAQRGLRRLGVH